MSHDTIFHKIYLSSRETMARVVSRIVPPKEVEDIVQETYVRVCQIENKEQITSPKSFMMKMAKNLALDHIKQANVRLVDMVEDEQTLENLFEPGSGDEMFQQAASNQEFADFCEAIRLLPQQSRKAFVLKKVYGYSQKEIANELGLSESTVEKHIAAGMKRCMSFMRNRSHLNEHGKRVTPSMHKLGGMYE